MATDSLVSVRYGLRVGMLFGLAILAGTRVNAAPPWEARPLAALESSPNATQFERLDPEATGINFQIPIDTTHPLKRLYTGGFFAGSVAVGDVNGDDRPDVYLVSGPGANRLYLQQEQPFNFIDTTDAAKVDSGDDWGVGAAMVDIDNDGDLDLYVCNYDAPNRLFINDGRAGFREAAAEFALDIVDSSVVPAFCDYDGDGDLDLYLLTNRYFRPGGLPADLKLLNRAGNISLPSEYEKYFAIEARGRNRGELQLIGQPDRLLRQGADHKFVDVTQSAGIAQLPDHGLAATWWDYNDDGWMDLYVSNDFNDPDHLYRNDGDGTFTDTIEMCFPHTAWFAMGADAGDINNDGRLDFMVADMSGTTHFDQKLSMGAMGGKNAWLLEYGRPLQYMRNALYLNTGTPRFQEIAYLTGLDSTDWTWSVKFADLDNDTRLDLFVTNGMTRNLNDSDLPFTVADEMGKTRWELYESQPPLKQQNLAFRNRGDLHFENVSAAWGLDHVGISCGAAMADLDRDGDLDMIVINVDEPSSVYRNHAADGHRILVQLRGESSNRFGVGATVKVETATGVQVRPLVPVSGYMASHDPVLHFGLGAQSQVQRLTVRWPNGKSQVMSGLAAGQFYTIHETIHETASDVRDDRATTEEATTEEATTAPTLLQSFELPASTAHRETRFDDFREQPLLPNRLSQLGPGIACGDVDADGDDDFYFGGAAGQPGRLMLNLGHGMLSSAAAFPFDLAAASEEMGALFVDVDADGDLDLYVVSGGVEYEIDAPEYADHLYLNDGHGRFLPAPLGTIPDLRDSGSTVNAADFDQDGDLDLFVGGRVVPGRYPSVPRSRLLRNDGGRFADATESVAAGLSTLGMVTAALWTDVDADGWVDLLVTSEWGPIHLYRNEQGRLRESTAAAGLQTLTGWWNGIAGRDLDGDGDIDYVVTNFGLNTKYHATADKPVLLFYGDVDGSGKQNLIEAEFENNSLFPVRGRSCSSNAMPTLRNKFPSFRSFASAELNQIYDDQQLKQAQRFAATTLESGILRNDGQGQFEFEPLPVLAQVAPGFSVILSELNGDGYCDMVLAQNFFTPQVETGRMDGGVGLVLLGSASGQFAVQSPAESGLVVPQDAKSAVLTDLNGDTAPDIVIGINNERAQAFLNRATQQPADLPADQLSADQRVPRQAWLHAVKPRARPGNPTGIGTRVTVRLSDGTLQTAEVYAGSGYLSQSSPTLWFGTRGLKVQE